MYIRRSTRTYKGKTYTNYVLVASVQTPRGPRQKTICSLGDLSPRPREDWLKLAHKLEHALVGQGELLHGDVLPRDPELDSLVEKVRSRRRPPARAAAAPAPSPASAPADDGTIAGDPRRVTTEQHREAGPVHVGYQFWNRLGLGDILRDVGIPTNTRQLAGAMILNRLIQPASEHAMPDWLRRTALADILGTDFEALVEDPLYRVLDKLHPHRAAIEAALVERERSLFNLDRTIYLYDLTSTDFEGQALANPKAQRGYSRDHRPDCKQVVVGLVVNRDGFPIAHEIFAGNTQDRTTLATMLDRLKARIGLPEGSTIVVDRGMAGACPRAGLRPDPGDENIAEIKARKLHYLVASRQPERTRWLAECGDPEGFAEVRRQSSPRNPAQHKTRVEIKIQRDGDTTHVLCRSQQRSAKDRAIRTKQQGRLLADLEKLRRGPSAHGLDPWGVGAGQLKRPEKIAEAIGRLKERYPRVARYYDLAVDPDTAQFSATLHEDELAKAARLDGCYLINTDRDDLSAEDCWRLYALLTRAEDAFRDMKTPLAERPIYHQNERRVESHIFLCVLAFHLLVAIEKTLFDQGLHTSWATVRDTLKTHQVCTIVLPTKSGQTLRIRKASTPEKDVAELYALLGLSDQVIKPIYQWTDSPRSD
jgi:transposase